MAAGSFTHLNNAGSKVRKLHGQFKPLELRPERFEDRLRPQRLSMAHGRSDKAGFAPEQLRDKAWAALEEAAERSNAGPVERDGRRRRL